jgi:hypothetical protein
MRLTINRTHLACWTVGVWEDGLTSYFYSNKGLISYNCTSCNSYFFFLLPIPTFNLLLFGNRQ